MTLDDSRLRRHLAIAVTVKMLALLVLWWFFFQGSHPAHEEPAATISDHILGTPPPQGEPL